MRDPDLMTTRSEASPRWTWCLPGRHAPRHVPIVMRIRTSVGDRFLPTNVHLPASYPRAPGDYEEMVPTSWDYERSERVYEWRERRDALGGTASMITAMSCANDVTTAARFLDRTDISLLALPRPLRPSELILGRSALVVPKGASRPLKAWITASSKPLQIVAVDEHRRFFRTTATRESLTADIATTAAQLFRSTPHTTDRPERRREPKLELAKEIVQILVPFVMKSGSHERPNRHSPEHFRFGLPGYEVVFMPWSRDNTCATLDIWPIGGRKVFSARWSPLEVIRFQRGDWIDLALGLRQGRGVC